MTYPTHNLSTILHTVQPPGAAQIKLPQAFRIAHIEQDNYRTKTFTLDGELDAEPGQFVMAWLPRFDEKPFSLVNNSPITLMITAVGPFTRLVHSLEVGDPLWIRGAYGRGFEPVNGAALTQGGGIALVAGGYGVAPLYWLARTLTEAASDSAAFSSDRKLARQPALAAILGARHSEDLLYADRFAKLFDAQRASVTGENAQSKSVQNESVQNGNSRAAHRLLLTTDDGSRGLQGRVTDALTPLLDQQEVDTVYACGPDVMLAAVGELCRAHSVAAQLSWEAYMRCGVGLCGSCEHGGQLLCLDGPVLPL